MKESDSRLWTDPNDLETGAERQGAMKMGATKRADSTARFERFRAAYKESGNALRAALEAGYSPRMAKSKSYLLARRARIEAGEIAGTAQGCMRVHEVQDVASPEPNTPGFAMPLRFPRFGRPQRFRFPWRRI